MRIIQTGPATVLAEAEVIDADRHTVTDLQTTFSIEDPSVLSLTPTYFVRNFYAAASLSIYQAVQGSWEVVTSQKTISDIDYQAIEDRYKQLRDTVSDLSQLDEDDDRSIDEETAQAGQEMIHWLDLASVPAPKVFSHGGDSIVFTWNLGDSKRYLTPIDGLARVREYSNKEAGKLLDAQNFDLRNGGQTVKLLKLIGGTKWKVVK